MACLTEILYKHAMEIGAISSEQKALIWERRGHLDAHHINTMVTRTIKEGKRSMSVAWVDYQKAYDRVPRQWIRDMLKAVKVSRNVERMVRHAMGMWQTTFGISNGSKETFQIWSVPRGLLVPFAFLFGNCPYIPGIR